jgi:hypothetical protein
MSRSQGLVKEGARGGTLVPTRRNAWVEEGV